MRLAVLAIVLGAWVPRAAAQDVEPESADERVQAGLLGPMPAPAAETVELRADGAAGLDAAGQVAWTIPHASLRGGVAKSPPVVLVGAHAIYAVGDDLLRVELATGHVVGRVRFPAAIDDLVLAKDGKLDVRLRDATHGGASVDVIHYAVGGEAPGRATTDPVPWSASWRDAVGAVVPAWDPKQPPPDLDKLPADARDLGLTAVTSAAERDPTNAHYRLLEGQLLRLAHRDADAKLAFTAAATLPGAPWTDLLHVWTRLELLGEVDAAATAYDRAVEGMTRAGVRPDRQRGLIMLAPYVPRAALVAAIDANDADRVDAISSKLWALEPRVEGGRFVWAQLAAWLAAHDRAELAETWRARAAAGGGLFGVEPDAVDLDAWNAVAAAFLTAIPIVALLIGLRRGAASRTTPAQFPYVQLVDLAALLLPLLPAVYARLQVVDAFAEIDRNVGAPMSLFGDAVDAESVTFVERELPDSDAKTRVLAYMHAELDAMRAGGRSDAEPFDAATLHEAFNAKTPLGARLRRLDADDLDGEQRVPTPSFPSALGLGLVLFAVGFVITRRKPGAQVVARFVPGGAGPLWAFGGLVTGALIAALYHFLWQPWIGEITAPSYSQAFGLEHLPELPEAARPTPWWPFAAIGFALAAQATAAWLELRRR